MNYFQLITALLPIAEEIFKAIESAKAAGKAPALVHGIIVDHISNLPGLIREA